LAVTSAMVYWLPNVRTKFNRGARHFFKQLMTYKDHKSKLVFGLASSIGLTLSNVVALLFSLQAVNSHLALSSVMLAFSFAIWLGAVIPVPGGVGSVEAGLVGALVAFNLALPQAVAAVLIFRLISFWLPLILGMPALVWVRRRGYI